MKKMHRFKCVGNFESVYTTLFGAQRAFSCQQVVTGLRVTSWQNAESYVIWKQLIAPFTRAINHFLPKRQQLTRAMANLNATQVA